MKYNHFKAKNQYSFMPICLEEFSLDDGDEFPLLIMEPKNLIISLKQPGISFNIELLNYCNLSRLLSGSPFPAGTSIHTKNLVSFTDYFDETKQFSEYFLECACGTISYAYFDFYGEFQTTFYKRA